MNTSSPKAIEKLSQPNLDRELPEGCLAYVAMVLAFAANLAPTLADARGKGLRATVLPEIMNDLSRSLNNNVGFGRPAQSGVALQVFYNQLRIQTLGELEDDFAENAFSARPKRENCPFWAASQPLQYAQN
jgi:hypothetical protein